MTVASLSCLTGLPSTRATTSITYITQQSAVVTNIVQRHLFWWLVGIERCESNLHVSDCDFSCVVFVLVPQRLFNRLDVILAVRKMLVSDTCEIEQSHKVHGRSVLAVTFNKVSLVALFVFRKDQVVLDLLSQVFLV